MTNPQTETKTPAQEFADWLSAGPRLAKAAGVYVGITVRPTPIPQQDQERAQS